MASDTRKSLKVKVNAFVAILVAACGEKVQGVVKVKVVVAVKVALDKGPDLLLALVVAVVQFMHGAKLVAIEAIREDPVGLALQQVLRLVRRDVRDSGEDVSTVGCSTLQTVAMIDASSSRLLILVKVLEMVVKVFISRAQVSSKQRRMGREDRGHPQVAFSTEDNSHTGHPLMVVRDDGHVGLQVAKLDMKKARISGRRAAQLPRRGTRQSSIPEGWHHSSPYRWTAME